ncbi:MAG: twin-arginine translocation signal domain-containing protein [Prevotellaceae bacterium]|nr:twin-arginine translocation signal domain-containing protein [Prevotellaceae bacterium]
MTTRRKFIKQSSAIVAGGLLSEAFFLPAGQKKLS